MPTPKAFIFHQSPRSTTVMYLQTVPLISSKNDRLCLKSCREPGRKKGGRDHGPTCAHPIDACLALSATGNNIATDCTVRRPNTRTMPFRDIPPHAHRTRNGFEHRNSFGRGIYELGVVSTKPPSDPLQTCSGQDRLLEQPIMQVSAWRINSPRHSARSVRAIDQIPQVLDGWQHPMCQMVLLIDTDSVRCRFPHDSPEQSLHIPWQDICGLHM